MKNGKNGMEKWKSLWKIFKICFLNAFLCLVSASRICLFILLYFLFYYILIYFTFILFYFLRWGIKILSAIELWKHLDTETLSLDFYIFQKMCRPFIQINQNWAKVESVQACKESLLWNLYSVQFEKKNRWDTDSTKA